MAESVASQPSVPSVSGAKTAVSAAPITRRNFLWLGWSSLAGFLASGAAAAARYFFPNVIYEPSQKFNAGKAQDYPMGVSTKWLNEQRVWIVRTEKGFYTVWARCTHLGCTPNWFGDQNRFRCPCHGSNFNPDGDVIAGPAPKPLYRCAVQIASTGDLIIDKAMIEGRPGFRDKSPYFAEFRVTV